MQRNTSKVIRDKKGNNLIDFPDDYAIIDIETTGTNIYVDSIIEVSALKVKNNKVVNAFDKLLRPESTNDDYVDSDIEELTGITNEMLDEAEDTKTVLKEYYDFIGNSIVIGHNVNRFDVNFLYDNFKKYLGLAFTNDFVDTLTLYMKIKPKMKTKTKTFSLKSLCEDFGIENKNAHRAYSDCKANYLAYLKLRETILDKYDNNVSKFINECNNRRSSNKRNSFQKIIKGNLNKINIDSPLYKKGCVFTGTFQKVTRDEEFQIVKNIGGRASRSIGKKTDFLFCNNEEYLALRNNNLDKKNASSSLKLALEKINSGSNMKILSESDFYDMVGENIDDLKSNKD